MLKKKIKIAYLITRMDWGGAPDIVRILSERLDRVYDIRLIYGLTTHPSLKTENFFNKFKENIFYLPFMKREINIFNDSLSILFLYHLFRKERFDIVHTHTLKAGVVGRIAAWLAGVPVVIHSPHGHNFYGYFGPFLSKQVVVLERFMANFTTKILVFTELEKRDLVGFKVCRPGKIVVINSGLELERYRGINIEAGKKKAELKVAPEAVLVGMAGRLDPIKGPKYFVEAGRLILQKFPQVKFLVVGDGSLRRELENKCKKSNIFGSFIFTGWREDIPGLLSALDILVLPSLNEAVGRVLIEAGACGIPVVATRVGGVPEIVKDNETGILVPPKDTLALAQGIAALLRDKQKRIKMGEAARHWVDDKFSDRVMVNKITHLYEECMK